MRLLAVLAVVILTGCEPPARVVPSEAVSIQMSAYRDAFFERCMQLLPVGPQATKYNDWDEVVESCSEASLYHMHTRFP